VLRQKSKKNKKSVEKLRKKLSFDKNKSTKQYFCHKKQNLSTMLSKKNILIFLIACFLLTSYNLTGQTPEPTKNEVDTTKKIGNDLLNVTDNDDEEMEELFGTKQNTSLTSYLLQDLPDIATLLPSLQYLEDKDAAFTIQQLVTEDGNKKFTPYGNEFRLAQKDIKGYWLKMTLTRNSNITTDWVFAFDKQIDLIELYTEQGSGFVKIAQTGTEISYKDRTLAISDLYVNYLPIKVYDKPVTCYIKIVCNPHIAANNISLSPNILKMSDIQSIALNKYYPQGIYFGAMLFLIFFNLGIFGLYKDQAKIWFIFSLVVTMCYQLALRGFFEKNFAFNIFTPLQQYFSFVFAALSIIVFAQFSRVYLRAKEFMPILDKVLVLLILLAGLLLLTGFVFEYQKISNIITYLSPLSMFVILLVSLIGIRREYQPAKFLFIGVLFTLLGATLYALEEASYIEATLFTNNALQLGEVFLGLLITIGLVVRLNRKNQGGKII
jgi:hypothetical protein